MNFIESIKNMKLPKFMRGEEFKEFIKYFLSVMIILIPITYVFSILLSGGNPFIIENPLDLIFKYFNWQITEPSGNTPSNFLSDFPEAVFSGLITLFGIWFAIIMIVYALEHLPRKILVKYSFYQKWTYLYISFMFWSIITTEFLALQNLSIWGYYILFVYLSFGVLATLGYVFWFNKRISKEGVYCEMKNKLNEAKDKSEKQKEIFEDFFICIEHVMQKSYELKEEIKFLEWLAKFGQGVGLDRTYLDYTFNRLEYCIQRLDEIKMTFISDIIYMDRKLWFYYLEKGVNDDYLNRIMESMGNLNHTFMLKQSKSFNKEIYGINSNLNAMIGDISLSKSMKDSFHYKFLEDNLYLFDLPKDKKYFEGNTVNNELRKAFSNNGLYLSIMPKIIKEDGKNWRVEDGYKTYKLKDNGETLKIYDDLLKYKLIIKKAIKTASNIVKITMDFYNLNPALNEKYLNVQINDFINFLNSYPEREDEFSDDFKKHWELKQKDILTADEKTYLDLCKQKKKLIDDMKEYRDVRTAFVLVYGLNLCLRNKLPSSLSATFLEGLKIIVERQKDYVFFNRKLISILADHESVQGIWMSGEGYSSVNFDVIAPFIEVFEIFQYSNNKEFIINDKNVNVDEVQLEYLDELLEIIQKSDRDKEYAELLDTDVNGYRSIKPIFKEYIKKLKDTVERHATELKKGEEDAKKKRIETATIDEERKGKFREETLKEYKANTKIEEIASLKEFDSKDESSTFEIPYRALLPKEGFIKDEMWIPTFGLGEGISNGEINHLIKRIDEKVKGFKVVENDAEKIYYEIVSTVNEMKKEGFNPGVIFLPLDVLSLFWESNLSQKITHRPDSLKIDETTSLKIINSNNFIPFDKIIILDKNSGTWTFKPDKETVRLHIEVKEYEKDKTKVDVLIKTIVNYQIENPNGIKILSIKENQDTSNQ